MFIDRVLLIKVEFEELVVGRAFEVLVTDILLSLVSGWQVS